MWWQNQHTHAEYFVVFINDKTHYMWVSIIKHKMLQKFVEWKTLVEKSSRKTRKLRIDNNDFVTTSTSTNLEDFITKEGIEHQYTIPNMPEQNGISERMNRTRVETVRSMLAD